MSGAYERADTIPRGKRMTRDSLHAIIDKLPESHLEVAAQYLEDLERSDDPLAWALAHAPLDDEPDADDADAGLTEARKEASRGDVVTHEEIKRRWGGS